MVAKLYVCGVDVSNSVDWTHFSICRMTENNYKPVRVIYNDPYTTCYFPDGSKEIVKIMIGDTFSKEGGVLECIAKKVFKSHNEFKRVVEGGYVQPVKEKNVGANQRWSDQNGSVVATVSKVENKTVFYTTSFNTTETINLPTEDFKTCYSVFVEKVKKPTP